MASTAAQIIDVAQQIAKCPRYDTQALALLNVILDDLCDTYDLGVAREAELNAIPTRLSLPSKNIDDAIAAGFDAASGNATLKNYVQQRKHRHQSTPQGPPKAPTGENERE